MASLRQPKPKGLVQRINHVQIFPWTNSTGLYGGFTSTLSHQFFFFFTACGVFPGNHTDSAVFCRFEINLSRPGGATHKVRDFTSQDLANDVCNLQTQL